jgi:hypothetical protein
VRLEFALPLGEQEVQALVRQRNASRNGFQFVENRFRSGSDWAYLPQLAVEQALPHQERQ